MSITKVSSTIYECRDLEAGEARKGHGETFRALKLQFEDMVYDKGFGPYQSVSVLETGAPPQKIIAHTPNGDRRGCIRSVDINDRTKECGAVYSELRANISIFHDGETIPADEYEIYVTNDHFGTTVFSIHAREHFEQAGMGLFFGAKNQKSAVQNIKSMAKQIGFPDDRMSVKVA